MHNSADSNKGITRRVKQHVIAKMHNFFAVVQPGFEETAKNELFGIGIEEITETIEGGIQFRSKLDGCYRANLCSRTITRLMMRLTSFKVTKFDRLGRRVYKFPWELYLKNDTYISFSIKCRHSRLYHTGRIEEEFIRSIRSRLSDYKINIHVAGKDFRLAKQIIFIRFNDDECQISLDTSGEMLYKRGYKKKVSPASLRETLASLILLESGISGYDVLIDPMCGSGTFSLEAAEIFANRIPSKEREFAFMLWPSYKPDTFSYIKRKISENEKDISLISKRIMVNDIDKNAVSIAKDNLLNTGLFELFEIMNKDFLREPIEIPENSKCFIVLNPPYGSRLKINNIKRLYSQLGNVIRNRYQNCGYAIITASLECEKYMSLTYDKKILFMNGGIKAAVIIRHKCL